MGQIPVDYRSRVTTSPAEDDYNPLNYLTYCLYPPLYIAGPIVTFNDFMCQVGLSGQILSDSLSFVIPSR